MIRMPALAFIMANFDEFDFEPVDAESLHIGEEKKREEEIGGKYNIDGNRQNREEEHNDCESVSSDIPKQKIKVEYDPEKQGYVCVICFKVLKTCRKLEMHTKQMHGNQERIECTQCYKTFTCSSSLKRHLQTHIGESGKTVFCDKCGKSFYREADMRSHRLIIHGERLKCTQCERTFYSSKHLKAHQVITHGVENTEGVNIYKCDKCEKAFIKSDGLSRHRLIIHTGERNFPCATCGKAFTHSWILVAHTKVHSEEKPFKCDICPKAFKSQNTLNRHTLLNRHKYENKY